MSQNLVKNPSFEFYDKCPVKLGNLKDDLHDWSAPTIGSTDYFNSCSTAMGTPENFNGSQPSNFGKGYAGLYLYAPEDYREYLQVELDQQLVKGKNYRVSFYVSLAERSDFAIKEFGVLFSNKKLDVPIKKELSKMHLYKQEGYEYNYLEIGYSNFYSDTKDWILVHTQFKAKGAEKYIVIGNFKSNKRTRMFRTKRNANQGAYYYIDMVSVALQEPPLSESALVAISNGKETKNIELDKSYVFKNVLFEFDKSVLLAPSKIELQKVVQHLEANAMLSIAIHGHTDNVGKPMYNKQLSHERAAAVAEYLITAGISKDRISWQGYGSEVPLMDNNNETNRQLNRRVEFIISKEKN
ncbi:OmpA family protein [Aurantibacter crassamenti]|uniref:OmpA family protein n=1 Tax=Aurantibacter crassamenti TaxID=1837375 RepID=UPI00293D81DA|nr:OmpA family protein [Aurantibacter crassamenti]